MHNIRAYRSAQHFMDLFMKSQYQSQNCICSWKWTAYEVVGVAADGGDEDLQYLHLACSAPPRARGRRRADCDNTDPAAASSQHINCNNTSLTQWKAKPRNIKSIRFLPFLPLLGSFFVGSTIFKKIFGRYFLVCLNCCRRPCCTTPSPGHQRSQM